MSFIKRLLAAAAMLLLAGQASATITVNFTNVESPGVSCCGPLASNAYSAFGLTVTNAYWYSDGRDTFDGQGISVNIDPATIGFNTASNGISFQYWVIGGFRGRYEAFDASNTSLGSLLVDATGGADVLGTHSFLGLVDHLTFSGSNGFVQVSAVTFDSGSVPEPSALALLALGFAAFGANRGKLKNSQ